MSFWEITAWGSLLWATGVLLVTLIAIGRRTRLARPADDPSRGTVLLVRPCAGAEPWLGSSLTSVLSARRPRSLVTRITVAEDSDAALPVAREAAELIRARCLDADVVVGALDGPNRKVAQLAHLLATGAAGAEIVINADSDVDLTGFDLDALARELTAHPERGAVWVPTAEVGPAQTLGDRASQAFLNGSLHSFQLLAGLDPDGFVGKLFAIRTDALKAAGGFGSLADFLGEDMALAAALRRAGYRPVAVPLAARARRPGQPLSAVIGRFGRWLAVIRAQRPLRMLGYPLLFGAALPVAILAGLSLALGPAGVIGPAIATLAVLVTARIVAAVAARRLAGLPAGPLVVLGDAALAELVVWRALFRSLVTREVVWRGRRLRLGPDGRLREQGPMNAQRAITPRKETGDP